MDVGRRDASTSPAAGRLAWIDMARGFCVIAVVLLHVALFHVMPLSPDPHGRPLARAWTLFNTAVLADLRMPLLLLLSGYLARTKVRQGLGYARTRLAVATNLHLYLVWTVVFFALGVLFFPRGDDVAFHGRSWPGLLASLGYPQNGPLWFVYVLALSLAALAATRRFPRWIVLAGFFVVGWGVLALTGNVAGLPRGIFYAAGALVGEELIGLTTSWLVPVVAFVGYGVLSAAIEKLDPVTAYPITVVAGLLAAVAFLALAQVVARLAILRRPGAWIGRRTLGIYVLHWPLVALLTWAGTTHADRLRPFLGSQVADIAYPVVVTALVVVACVALERLLRAVSLGVLFDLPSSVAARLTRGARGTAASANA